MGRRESLKLLRSGTETLCHRILNDVADAIREEVKERAHTDLPGPTGKSVQSNQVSVRLVFTGEVAERDQVALREVMQKIKNPAELLYLLSKHGRK